jgi:superfamily II DNA/RNA helicase
MFDPYARSLLVDVPELEGLTGDEMARALSRAYLALLHFRINREEATEDVIETQAYLRRLANALTFQVVFDDERPIEVRRAAAFATAEAIALVSDFVSLAAAPEDVLESTLLAEHYTRVEAALFYLFARYDACAAGVLSLPGPDPAMLTRVDEAAAAWCISRIEDLCQLRTVSRAARSIQFTIRRASVLSAPELAQDTVARLFSELGRAVIQFSDWLTAGGNGFEQALQTIDSMLTALAPASETAFGGHLGHDYARVYHLATLLRLVFPDLSQRAVCHVVPSPPGLDAEVYRSYLMSRARGTSGGPGRPVLWPSALEYVKTCLLGDYRHAVVSMPTGSGKSFIGELAASQALGLGWVLYLAPTNALAEQIRRDLSLAFKTLDTDILAFVGDQEYSVLRTDTVSQMRGNSVAVMTPEKCALALRLTPEVFANCALVVFDECHLIGETGSTRSATAELVISQLMLRAVHCRFVLMSAIIQNPQDLAGWLESATGLRASPVTIRWRPTRTLRAVLGVENNTFQLAATSAEKELRALPERRKRIGYTAKCVIAACLQGAWQSTDEVDYGVASIDCDAQLSVKRERRRGEWHYEYNAESWVNATAVELAALLAKQGVQTMVFTPASKHYPFSNASKVILDPSVLEELPPQPPSNEIHKMLAEFELGSSSEVFDLLSRGVAVHTALMLEVEKIGSEAAFKNRSVPIMFATGTLAQGLNLPAIAVIIAGTRIGDPRGEEAEVVEQRKLSQLLNAAGRAGRAGFANQGVVITIPDQAFVFAEFQDLLEVRRETRFLQEADNAVAVGSGLNRFLDNVCNDLLRSDQASDTELEVISLLAGGDANQLDSHAVLQKTYAAYLRRRDNLAAPTTDNVRQLITIRDSFINETGAPEWLTVAAQRAGLDYFLTLAIFRAWSTVRQEWTADLAQWSVMEWLDEFLAVVKNIAPGLLSRHLEITKLARASTEFDRLVKKQTPYLYDRSIDWTARAEWERAWNTIRRPLDAWMHGETIVSIAAIITNTAVDEIPFARTQGKPLPKTLSVAMDTWSSLSLITGGFLAVGEQLFNERQMPLALACLPMCIKYGCDSPGTLAWFRFGVRLRRASRVLATIFPPPPDAQTDEGLRNWVRQARRDWLTGESHAPIGTSEDVLQILEVTRQFITA